MADVDSEAESHSHSVNAALLTGSAPRARSYAYFLGLSLWALATNFAFAGALAARVLFHNKLLMRPAAEFALATPMLRSLGLSNALAAVVWLAGPLSGLVVQPLVGELSDRSESRFGRRRVFLAAGLLMTLLGMLAFGSAKQLGGWLSGEAGSERARHIAIAVAVVSLWLLNIGANVMQSPGWALMLDLSHTETETARATSSVTALSSIGNISSFLLGFANLLVVFPFFASNAQALFFIGVLSLFLTIGTLVLGKEERHVRSDADHKAASSLWATLRAFAARVAGIKRRNVMLLIAFTLSGAAMTPVLFFYTNFVGEAIFHGSPNTGDAHLKKLYDDGVSFGSLLLAALNVLVLVLSLALPFILRFWTAKQVYLFSHFVGCGYVFALLATRTAAVGVVVVGSVVSAVVNTVPFALLQSYSSRDGGADRKNNGFGIGLMNIAQVCGQMAANLLYGGVVSWTGNNSAAGLALGALFSLLGIPFIWMLDDA